MKENVTTLVKKVRKAIDDIAPDGTLDTFASDVDAEIEQALVHAAMSLSRNLPLAVLEPSMISETTQEPSWQRGTSTDGSGYIAPPDDFLRFVSLKMSKWKGTVSKLIEPGSEEEKHQRSEWSRGSEDKPKAMMDADTVTVSGNSSVKSVIRFWPGGNSETLTVLVYIRKAKVTEASEGTAAQLDCALKDECEKNLIYLAASIFLEGKKEGDVAKQFAELSQL